MASNGMMYRLIGRHWIPKLLAGQENIHEHFTSPMEYYKDD
jgi:hypothetical protein